MSRIQKSQSKQKSNQTIPKEKRKPQKCCFCKNHGVESPKKDHKNVCKFKACECVDCQGTKQRQLYSAREKRKHYPITKSTQVEYISEGRQRKEQKCRKCLNHNIATPMRDHKKFCPYVKCECLDCKSTINRRRHVTEEARTKRQREKECVIEVKGEEIEMDICSPVSTYADNYYQNYSPDSSGYETSSPHYIGFPVEPQDIPHFEVLLPDNNQSQYTYTQPQNFFEPQYISNTSVEYNLSELTLLEGTQNLNVLPELNFQINF